MQYGNVVWSLCDPVIYVIQLFLGYGTVWTGKSVKLTSKKYKTLRTTLAYKVSGKLPVGKRMGPKSLFPPEQEAVL